MNGEGALQAGAAEVEIAAGDADAPHEGRERWLVDRVVPAICLDADLIALIPAMAHSMFYKRKALGEFRFLELRPQLPGSNTRYSGHLIRQWLRGDLVVPGEPRRFFGAAAKRTGRPKRRAQQAVSALVHGDQSAADTPGR